MDDNTYSGNLSELARALSAAYAAEHAGHHPLFDPACPYCRADPSPVANHRPPQDHGDGVVRQRRAGVPLRGLAGVVELRPGDACPDCDAGAVTTQL